MFEFLDSLLPQKHALRAKDISGSLGYKPSIVARWVQRGILPPPFLVVNKRVHLYERKAVLEALARFLAGKQGVTT